MTPVEIVANKICRNHEHGIPDWTGHACAECTEWAGELLAAVRSNGWRIVRAEASGGVFHVGDLIVEDWTP